MFSVDEKNLPANQTLAQSVQTLILGRMIITFLLLVTTWIWYSGSLRFSFDSFPQGPLLVFVFSVGLSIVYFFFLRLSKQLGWQIRLQFLIDSLLITWLVWRTGDLTSPYITLYIVLVSVTSIFLRPVATLLMSFLCSALFTALAVLTAFSLIENFGTRLETSRIIQITSFHVVAFLVVGLLAARLAERRSSGEQLKEATKNLASLRALHERIIESIRSGLITTDLEGTIFTFNAAAAEITGRTAEEMQGQSISTLFGDMSQAIALSLESGGEQSSRFEVDLETPDGFAVHVGYTISQLFSEENEATGLIVTFQDLTEIRSMEESIRRKDRLAAVGRVGAGLAHEIRNPLGAMRGAIQVLKSNTPPDSVNADLMDIVLRESDRLNSIITNVLSFVKPNVGRFAEIDVTESIRDTLKLLRHSPDVLDGHVLEDLLPRQPVFITADVTQLKQIFWNLARNAIQAMPDGGKLTVKLEQIPNNRIKIIFEDTGMGMSSDRVEQLFEPFAKSTSGGTGLGLSIVYQIIRDHNGTINVRSFEGEGTTITVELPRDHHNPAPRDIQAADGARITNLLNVKNETRSEPPA